ncbi:dihydrolipoamide dehydrogenase [Mycoplasmopsis californica HAZ160_1]|uniref:Dihydrolipoamide dehydrogenase n=1 Tax=Mycoplasmopsis californica HAZ160_1 TaxID=1397850 RepID=A0AAT9F8A4_9BACT|nr:dihydrolipoyl dehydrogenase [Mycoplasmopsis californica]BAP01152.1 dihydrolipoamide dehydrogenase [Mycoplasmopsis californica HAZ160_1]BBG41018.1 dihydrolipoamide dehydrogenase [Mycoplasmopsis californica]BBG41611.1 dihydrolipoamide dehydrogenase [Mycoplasmopsis californica]BBG42205.1 dihydrolipoamide dehydrogenase [Mycoplasmopsis californica]BBG42787.1 dihydrolipoamide dehydrogenase [Mycoplasmopsis californica]
MEHFDVVIVGGGPGGYPLAILLSKKGKKVALIERKNLGGTCVNEGCIPSKTLIKSAKVFETVLSADKFGIKTSNPVLDFEKVQLRRKNNKIVINNKIKQQLLDAGVSIFEEEASVIDEHTISLLSANITFDKLVIATGSRARLLDIPGFSESLKSKDLIIASDILELDSLPKTLNIIGAGPIALEMAYLYSTFGTKVNIIDSGTFMHKYDSDLALSVKNYIMQRGIKIYENTQILSMDGKKLRVKTNESDEELIADKTLLAVGRQANVESFKKLNLELGSNGFVKVDDRMRTSVENVYALGDVTGIMMLSSVAYRSSDIVAREILGLKSNPINSNHIAWSVYLNPEFSGVGLTEQQIEAEGIDYVKVIMPANSLPRSLADGADNQYTFVKILVEKSTHKILGAFMFAEGAHLLINQISFAMQNNITMDKLQDVTFTHPTIAESLYYIWKMNAF